MGRGKRQEKSRHHFKRFVHRTTEQLRHATSEEKQSDEVVEEILKDAKFQMKENEVRPPK